MEYTLYTYGGQDLVVQVFNAIARIFQTDSEYFTPVGTLSLAIGGVWATTRAIFNQNVGIFGKSWFFPTFLSITLLFTPKATVWVKDDVLKNAPIKVDNVPFAVAFFASLSSTISHALSEVVETELMPAQGVMSTQSGLMFGARLVGKIKDVHIEDPILLENTKAFCKQCFTKPFLMGNLMGKRFDAMKSKDMLSFVKENMPRNFGIYYKAADTGIVSFKTCHEALSLIEQGLAAEMLSKTPFLQLADAIGLGKSTLDSLALRLMAVGGDSLTYLMRDTADLSAWVKQAMLLNANREAVDDWREGHNMGRIYPQLIAMNATRGTMQQSFGWLTAGEMAADTLPLLQTILFTIVICLIFVVFPFAMLPGGMSILITWIKMLLWVNSWPIFYAIINSIGMMVLAGKGEVFGSDAGLSILSQGSYSEVLLNTYAIVQLFATMVPIISWAVISKSGQIFASLSERLSPIGAGSTLGTSMVDNTINLDNVAIGNTSLAQQTAPNAHLASRMDTGALTQIQSPDGSMFIEQRSSQLRGAYSANDNISKTAQVAQQESITLQQSLSDQATKSVMNSGSSMLDYAGSVARGEVSVAGLSQQDQLNIASAREKALTAANNISEREGKSTGTTAAYTAQAGAWLLGSGVGFSTGTDAKNYEEMSREMNSSLTEGERASLNKLSSATQEGRYTASTDSNQRLAQSVQSAVTQQHQLAQQISKAQTYAENWNKAVSQIESSGGSVQHNLNDAVLEKVGEDKGISKAEATSWLTQNPTASTHYLRSAIEERFDIGALPEMPQRYKEEQAHVSKTAQLMPNDATIRNEGQISQQQVSAKAYTEGLSSQGVRDEIKGHKETLTKEKETYDDKVSKGPIHPVSPSDKTLRKGRANLTDHFDQLTQSTVLRTGGKVLENTGSAIKELYKPISEMRGGEVVGEYLGEQLQELGKKTQHNNRKE